MAGRIELRELALQVHIGVTPEERSLLQPVFVDLDLHLDLIPASQSDRVEDTINYVAVCECLEALAASRPFRLIESMAANAADTLLAAFPTLDRVWIRIRKPRALASRGITHTAVSLERSRT